MASSHPEAYKPVWRLTSQDPVFDHDTALEWSQHAFPPTTIESLIFLSNEHMADDLHYAAAQVSSYLVTTVERISEMETFQFDSDRRGIACKELKA